MEVGNDISNEQMFEETEGSELIDILALQGAKYDIISKSYRANGR